MTTMLTPQESGKSNPYMSPSIDAGDTTKHKKPILCSLVCFHTDINTGHILASLMTC